MASQSIKDGLLIVLQGGHHGRIQGRVQDFKKGCAESIACKSFSHAPKMLTTPLINAFVNGCFRPNINEKLPFREQILEASKFIVGL